MATRAAGYVGGLPIFGALNFGALFSISSGMPYRNNGTSLHDGIDFSAPAGTPVRSASKGVVVNVYYSHKNGTATLANPDGYGMLVDVL